MAATTATVAVELLLLVAVNVVVVSNRVAQAKPDEPIAGGLAAALIPMVRESGATAQ